MSRLPPSLLYLIIYNPTLQPPDSTRSDADDEDAQEQAHVLFYTANDHAVSKDRVLRQVGLAKALANFTTIFDPRASCESVHSQSRRMIMLSPEPNFWMHSCFELEKVPRISRKEDKGKAKQKDPVYDYNEASLHDAALQTQLLLGYEAFKIIHGSFTSILNQLGKEALELQLERFFTVWIWSFDFGRHMSFADYLGIRVHPLSTQLMPLIDVLEDKLPPHFFPIVLISSSIVASKSTPSQCSPALVRHLLRILEARTTASRRVLVAAANVPNGNTPSRDSKASAVPATERNHSRSASKTFLGIPGLNMNANMDVRKWNWSNYLTFGLGGSSSNQKGRDDGANEKVQEDTADTQKGSESGRTENSHSGPGSIVDSQALQDALSSEAGVVVSTNADEKTLRTDSTPPDEPNRDIPQEYEGPSSAISNDASNLEDKSLIEAYAPENAPTSDTDRTSPKSSPSPSFSELRVHLSNSDSTDTRCRIIRYLCTDNILFALVPTLENSNNALGGALCQDLAERSAELIERLKEIVEVEQEKIASAFSSSPVQSVLQKSQHAISSPNQLTYSSVSFSATSWHLHEGNRALDLNSDLQEVYSRGQNPQDWHLVKRGLVGNVKGNVFMEIGRKEASLVDVDNEVLGVLRRFTK
ncbi:hypothetical protein ACEPAF_608 [Sanghuangporus sanghuang]